MCLSSFVQVCNIAWSQSGNELITTHGYSQNHVIVWKYPSMAQLAKLPGHTKRVLYLVKDTHTHTHTHICTPYMLCTLFIASSFCCALLLHAAHQAMSPDGENVVTGAGDETLRFWHVFSKAHSNKVCGTLYYHNVPFVEDLLDGMYFMANLVSM